MYDTVQEIDRQISALGLEPFAVRGQIGMKAGFFLVIIRPDTPDDPDRLQALHRAAEEVLGVNIRV